MERVVPVVNIRRQGGAAVMTIPPVVLKALNLDVGSKLEISVESEVFTARAQSNTPRRRYSLRELLRGVTPEVMERLNAETAWAREGEPVGREL